MAEEIFEGYSDTFEVVSNPYGMVVNFNLSPPSMRVDGKEVARIRVSWEMAKVLVYLMTRHIKKREVHTGVSYPIPVEILNNLKIAKDDWDSLWQNQKFNIGEGQ